MFEPMGATAASLVESLPENYPKHPDLVERYPKWVAQKLLAHTLRGLAFLHRNGVVHGDVQPGNLLFSIDNIENVQENELKQDKASTEVPVERIDGKMDRWAPKKLYLNQSLHGRVKLDSQLLVKLSDLGACNSRALTSLRRFLTCISSVLGSQSTNTHSDTHRTPCPRTDL